MTKMKEISTSDGLYIHVSFYVNDDASFNVYKTRIENSMDKYFPHVSEERFIGETKNGKEIIYRLQKPIIEDNNNLKNFFNNLHSLFTVTSIFKPHFAQVQGEK